MQVVIQIQHDTANSYPDTLKVSPSQLPDPRDFVAIELTNPERRIVIRRSDLQRALTIL